MRSFILLAVLALGSSAFGETLTLAVDFTQNTATGYKPQTLQQTATIQDFNSCVQSGCDVTVKIKNTSDSSVLPYVKAMVVGNVMDMSKLSLQIQIIDAGGTSVAWTEVDLADARNTPLNLGTTVREGVFKTSAVLK